MWKHSPSFSIYGTGKYYFGVFQLCDLGCGTGQIVVGREEGIGRCHWQVVRWRRAQGWIIQDRSHKGRQSIAITIRNYASHKYVQKTTTTGSLQVFFKAGVLAHLEDLRDEKLAVIFTGVQARIRWYLGQTEWKRRKEQRTGSLFLLLPKTSSFNSQPIIIPYRTWDSVFRVEISGSEIELEK